MEKTDDSPVQGIYENGLSEFDKKGVIVMNIIVILWLVFGFLAVYLFYPPAGIVYGLFMALMFLFVMRRGLCTKCWYYNKMCPRGWGIYSAKLFKKDDISKFEGCAASKFAPFLWITVSLLPLLLVLVSAYLSYSPVKVILAVVLVLFILIPGSPKSRKKICVQCKMRHLCAGSAAKEKDS